MKAKLTPATESDLLRGIDWFERIAVGLGSQFETEFFNALERIKHDPDLFPVNHTGYRACRLKRFTGVIYFRIDRDWVVVVGLFTSGEDENALKRRG